MARLTGKHRYLVGVDLGKTGLRAGLVDMEASPPLQSFVTRSSLLGSDGGSPREIERVLQGVKAIAKQAAAMAGVEVSALEGIGVAVPFPVTPTGVVFSGQEDIIGWNNLDVRATLGALFEDWGINEIWADNDSTAHAVGELYFGHGQGRPRADLIYLTIGTGIGAGLILDGRIRSGHNGCAGEFGHVVVSSTEQVRCWGCGKQKGCLETLASGTAIAYRAAEMIDKGQVPALQRCLIERLEPMQPGAPVPLSSWLATSIDRRIDTKTIVGLAMDGFPPAAAHEAQQLVREAGKWLGKGLLQILHIINPSMVVLGGSLVKAGDLYLEPARQWVAEHALAPCADTPIYVSNIGEEAAVLGAAAGAIHGTTARLGETYWRSSELVLP